MLQTDIQTHRETDRQRFLLQSKDIVNSSYISRSTYSCTKINVSHIEPPVSSSDLIIVLYSVTQKGYD